MLFRLCIFLCTLFSLNACYNTTLPQSSAPASASPEPRPELSDSLTRFIESYSLWFEEQFRLNQSPGAALVIVKDSQIVFAKGYGVRKAGTNDKVDAHTVFRIGSLSKGFAGVLTGALVQDGLCRWDDPVVKYYPEFSLRDKAQANRVRLTHILSHSCGLPYHAYTNLLEEGWGVPKIVREYFPKVKLSGKEGEFFAYQNVAFCAIEEVIFKACGSKYTDLLTSRIYKPLEMNSASCDYNSINASENHAWPHFWTGAWWRPEPISTLYYDAVAAGGVNASITDMGKWLTLLLGHHPQLISTSTLDKVFEPRISTGKERHILSGWISGNEAAYGLGWRVLTPGKDTILYHAGYVNGFRGEIAFDRKAQIGVCALFNGAADMATQVVPTFFRKFRKEK